MRTKLQKASIMLSVTLMLVFSLLAVSGDAEKEAPKPGPEMRKLEVFVGDWKYEGEQFEPPIAGLPYGGAGKYFGTFKVRFILNGFFQENRIQENNPAGKMTIIYITGYDPIGKKYVEDMFQSDGTRSVSTFTLDDHTSTGNSTMTTADGKKVLLRNVATYSADWSRYTAVTEVSADNGKTWKAWFKDEGTKVKK